MSTFKNFTPHPIVLNDGTTFESIGIARVSASFTDAVDGVCDQEFGDVGGLPKPEEGVFLIVSAIVLAATKESGRTDCVAPATGHPDCTRSDKGYIVSVPCFVR